MKNRVSIILATVLALLSGCGKPAEIINDAESAQLSSVFVEQISGNPTPVPEARNTFKPGEKVVLTGLIMGVAHPFVEGRAVFVLGDEETITPCDDMDDKADDHCETPWDACCDPADIRANGTVTIQILDDSGKPAHAGLKGVNGLNELSRVTVSGTVAKNSMPEAFIVNATSIHIGVR